MGDIKKGDAGTTTRAVIYTRFSPRKNAEVCQSCQWQKAECEQYAFKNGYRVENIFNDRDVSGADAFRPMLWQAINSLRNGDVLLVWKWDRLARDLILALQIERVVEQKGASVVATTGDVPGNDPQAQFTRHILMAVSELERKMIKQRTSAAMKAHQRAGRRMSARVPYGWRVDPNDEKRIIEDAEEQETRKLIFELRENGLGYRKIVSELGRRNIQTRSGGKWAPITVKQIVERG